MNIVQSIIQFLQNPKSDQKAPDALCPNCWGRTEYAGKFYEAAKNENVDINRPNDQLGWIQDYANKHLLGIRLKPVDGEIICQTCEVTYTEHHQ